MPLTSSKNSLLRWPALVISKQRVWKKMLRKREAEQNRKTRAPDLLLCSQGRSENQLFCLLGFRFDLIDLFSLLSVDFTSVFSIWQKSTCALFSQASSRLFFALVFLFLLISLFFPVSLCLSLLQFCLYCILIPLSNSPFSRVINEQEVMKTIPVLLTFPFPMFAIPSRFLSSCSETHHSAKQFAFFLVLSSSPSFCCSLILLFSTKYNQKQQHEPTRKYHFSSMFIFLSPLSLTCSSERITNISMQDEEARNRRGEKTIPKRGRSRRNTMSSSALGWIHSLFLVLSSWCSSSSSSSGKRRRRWQQSRSWRQSWQQKE